MAWWTQNLMGQADKSKTKEELQFKSKGHLPPFLEVEQKELTITKDKTLRGRTYG